MTKGYKKADAVIRKERIIAIIRMKRRENLIPSAIALIEGGIRVVEFTMTNPYALEAISKLKEKHGEILVGAGTVLALDDARKAIDSGAEFLVSPIFTKDVAEEARRRDVLYIAGAFTPQEIYRAWVGGGDMIKLFPAMPAGIEYLRAILSPFPHIPLIPTGGVGKENALQFLRAGAVAIACGGSLLKESIVEKGELETIRRNALTLVELVKSL